ncbi:hypothetical protein SLEP1_g47192 [Rubroshorea leprosula]|uniref:Ribosomal protein L34Ae n=1 Tax=Rubroshorea leprosula TaxID=152421 RepID=A0AAV5LSA5_9ROSI|nr:hypothetical protein SLEP1_g47192 [Rubroshorea leprosula]
MQCSEEALLRLFYNLSSSFFLLLLFLYSSSVLLLKLFHFIGSYPLIQRNQYDYGMFSEDEQEEEEEEYNDRYNYHVNYMAEEHLGANIIRSGESVAFLSDQHDAEEDQEYPMNTHEQISYEDQEHSTHNSTEQFSAPESQVISESEQNDDDDNEDGSVEEQVPSEDADSLQKSDANQKGPTEPIIIELSKSTSNRLDKDEHNDHRGRRLEAEKLEIQRKDDEEIFGDSCTVGSTSKSSSEWRSSINCRDSTTDDPFSSSSRRSCRKWESYTVFQKYDEEMMFLHRISAQKLQETESLRSIQACPRSISERIVYKIAAINKKPSDIRHNPYHELEAAYVAEICLTWEALNWNYKNFEQKRTARGQGFDIGCPAGIAQRFQQFLVLLQRYVENEPYEQGRRPEIYARMRLLAPKLLLVPEYRDSEDDQKDEGFGSRISSAAFLMIMEDGIQTFMNFLKADREKPCQKIKSFFGKPRRGSVDPAHLNLTKKLNKKKKMKLKDLRRARKCIRKRKLKGDEEMEILMGLIDLKVVSRVLRMKDLSEEQLHWCEEKMSKVKVLDGKLQRNSSPLFFPAH